jgi:hypothetical protein
MNVFPGMVGTFTEQIGNLAEIFSKLKNYCKDVTAFTLNFETILTPFIGPNRNVFRVAALIAAYYRSTVRSYIDSA